jgi:transposase InsO family protein
MLELAYSAGGQASSRGFAKPSGSPVKPFESGVRVTVDNGSEFYSRRTDPWTYQRGVRLTFSRPGKPMDNPTPSRRISSPPHGEPRSGH